MKKIIQYIASDKVICKMKKLYPKWEVGDRLFEFYKSKIKVSILILFVGIIISFLTAIVGSKSNISSDQKITRNDYLKGNKSLTLTAVTEDKTYEKDIEINISEKKYSDKEIEELSNRMIRELETTIIAENESIDHITTNLNFVNRVEGYPFDISYRTDKPLILSREGVINTKKLEEAICANNNYRESNNESKSISNNTFNSTLKSDSDNQDKLNNYSLDKEFVIVEIAVTLTYMDYREDTTFYACIYEKELTGEEKFEKDLESALDKANDETIEEDYYFLPTYVDGVGIKFLEKKNNSNVTILILSIFTAALVFILKDKDLEKEIENKNKELLLEYPRLLNKFTLFYNAGMPIKLIWNKICDDYLLENEDSRNKKYIYEEMIITKSQIADGMREIDAYEDFANRIGIPCYRVFISLIEQAILLGKRDLIISLRKESEEAFINRKNNAKRLFEEAGTKLLIPMFMMLCVVIIIIMFPAFYSFRM